MTKTLSPLQLKKKINFVPHKAQQTILENLKRFSIICAGKKFGKSILASYIALETGLLPDKMIWIVAPTYDLAGKVYKYITDWVLKYFPVGIYKINKTARSIDCPSGSKIVCKSAEFPTGLLGENVDLEIVDEASRIGKDIWESYLRPNLTATKGSAIFISSPTGKNNWFYNLYLQGKQGKKDWVAFLYPSSANSYLDPKEIKKARATLPEQVFKQEYGGRFLDSSAQIFRGVEKIIGDCLRESEEGKKYVMGIDLGKEKDFSVLTIFDEESYKMVYFDRFSGVEWQIQRKRIVAVAERYNNPLISMESVGVSAPIVEDLRNEGLLINEFVSTTKSKQSLISKLIVFIENGLITIPNNEILIGELGGFGFEVSPTGNVLYRAKEGCHDDTIMSMALAIHLLPFRKNVPTEDSMARMVRRRWESRQRKRFREDQNRI